MPPVKAGCISLTIRPKGGLPQEYQDRILKFIDKYSSDSSCIIEMEDTSRHLHAALFLKKPTAPGDLFGKNKAFWRNVGRELEEVTDSIYSVMLKAEVVYNDDWVEKYLAKDEGAVILRSLSMLKEERLTHYVDRAPPVDHTYKGDPYYLKLEKLWFEYNDDLPKDIHHVNRFMCNMMFAERRINVISDPQRMKQKVRSLMMFLWQAQSYDYNDREFWMGQDDFEDTSRPWDKK